jgi:uncharacterized protein (DUF302 family)
MLISSPEYAMGKQIPLSFKECCAKLEEALTVEDLSVVHRYDLEAAIHRAFNIADSQRHCRVFAVCSTAGAEALVQDVPSIGAILPVNIMVHELDNGFVAVEYINPGLIAQYAEHPSVKQTAIDFEVRLKRALDALPSRKYAPI